MADSEPAAITSESTDPHWRLLTHLLMWWTGLVAVGLALALAMNHGPTVCVNTYTGPVCSGPPSNALVAGIGGVIWAVPALVMGAIWIGTKGRPCPVCGRGVRRGLTECQSCGHDFRATRGT